MKITGNQKNFEQKIQQTRQQLQRQLQRIKNEELKDIIADGVFHGIIKFNIFTLKIVGVAGVILSGIYLLFIKM